MKVVLVYFFIALSILTRFDIALYNHFCTQDSSNQNHITCCEDESESSSCCEPIASHFSDSEKIACCSTTIQVVSHAQEYDFKSLQSFLQLTSYFIVPEICRYFFELFSEKITETDSLSSRTTFCLIENKVKQYSRYIFYG